MFKLSDYKEIEDNIKKVVVAAPRLKSEDGYAYFHGSTIREMVQKFNGCLLVNIDGEYRFLIPAWRGYTIFENWPDYTSVKVIIFDGYWNV